MYAPHVRGANAYRQTSVQSSSPLELVVLLYDGALRHVVAASEAIQRNDMVARRDAVSKALAIITELQSTLNLEAGGEIATQLDALYTYITGRLVDSTARKDTAALPEVEKLLRSLREAWSQIASGEPAVAGVHP
jgi:flagellar secretion chaperone FliS